MTATDRETQPRLGRSRWGIASTVCAVLALLVVGASGPLGKMAGDETFERGAGELEGAPVRAVLLSPSLALGSAMGGAAAVLVYVALGLAFVTVGLALGVVAALQRPRGRPWRLHGLICNLVVLIAAWPLAYGSVRLSVWLFSR